MTDQQGERITCRVCGHELREVAPGRFGHTENLGPQHHYPQVPGRGRRARLEQLPAKDYSAARAGR